MWTGKCLIQNNSSWFGHVGEIFSCDMQVGIKPSHNIQSSNDRAYAYTWHGSMDMHQIGENQSHMYRKVSFLQIGCNSTTLPIVDRVSGERGDHKQQNRIDSTSNQLFEFHGGILIAEIPYMIRNLRSLSSKI
jgi:hypothetical protein